MADQTNEAALTNGMATQNEVHRACLSNICEGNFNACNLYMSRSSHDDDLGLGANNSNVQIFCL